MSSLDETATYREVSMYGLGIMGILSAVFSQMAKYHGDTASQNFGSLMGVICVFFLLLIVVVQPWLSSGEEVIE